LHRRRREAAALSASPLPTHKLPDWQPNCRGATLRWRPLSTRRWARPCVLPRSVPDRPPRQALFSAAGGVPRPLRPAPSGRAGRDRVGGETRRGRGYPKQFVRRAVGALRFEIDEGAVEGIACSAGREGALQGNAAETAPDVVGEARDGGRNARHCLAVTWV